MPSVRRRSRDPTTHGLKMDATETIRHHLSRAYGKRAFYLTIVLCFIFAAASLSWYNWQPNGEFAFTTHQGASNGVSETGDHGYVLHPQDHISRPPRTFEYQWRITKELRRPDGVLKNVYCVNGLFPGPTLEARSGDHLIIEVENALDDEGVSVHWHGISMRGANAMDGAVGITQNATLPGANFTYDFTIDESQHGTFWYHAHSQIQRADGLYGGLVVHHPASKDLPADERLLMIGDWYHRSAQDALQFYMHPGSFGNEPVPDSILLNGQGVFTCDDAMPARPLDCEQRGRANLATLQLESGRPTVLRLVNVGSYAGVGFKMDGTHLTPLRVDGGHRVSAQPTNEMGYLHPGERLDVLVQQFGKDSKVEHSLELSLDTSVFKYPNPSLTSTHRFPIAWLGSRRPRLTTGATVRNRLELSNIRSAEDSSSSLPHSASHVVVLYAITQKLAHLKNEPRGFINNTYWAPQTNPSGPLISLDRNLWDEHQLVPQIEYNKEVPQWVDIVLNNLDEEGHPFHLHGYDFWVLSTYSSTYNWGSYNPFEDEEPPGGNYDLIGAVKKDTVQVPRRGYAVLRMRADNPGIWMFHCHNLWHQASGMAMAFEVG